MYMRANAPALSLPYCPSLSPSTVFLPVVLGRVRGRFSLPLKSKNQKKHVRIKIICIGFPFSKIIDVDVLNVHCQVGKQKGRGHARTRVCGCIHTHPNITHHSAAYINERMGSGQNNARARALSLSLSLSPSLLPHDSPTHYALPCIEPAMLWFIAFIAPPGGPPMAPPIWAPPVPSMGSSANPEIG
jgi:hypothetical protein